MSILLLLAPINKSIGYYGGGDFIIKSNSITSRIERKKIIQVIKVLFLLVGK